MVREQQTHEQGISRPSCLVLPRCSMCDEIPPGGIRDGIRLKKAFICSGCERLIVRSDVASRQYQLLINQLRGILR